MDDLTAYDVNSDNIKRLQDAGVVPRVHGNGFIQLDYGAVDRLHFWGHPDIPRQTTATPIHDHAFDFRSICLRGRMVNICYGVDYTQADFKVYTPVTRHGEDTVLQDTGKTLGITTTQHPDVTVAARSSQGMPSMYYMIAGLFHETHTPEPTLTLMRKTARYSDMTPRVLVPNGVEPDNTFDRYAQGEDVLWRIIYDIVNS